MSDELIKSLNQRIAELERRVAQAEVSRKEARRERDTLKEQLTAKAAELDELTARAGAAAGEADKLKAALEAERDEWKGKATAAPTEQAARIAELETALRTRDFRDAFGKAVGDELGEGWDVDDVWRYSGFDPAKVDTLDPDQITELVGKAREAKPGLFSKPAAPGNGASHGTIRPPLKVSESPGRGARDSVSGRVTYKRADLARPGWQTSNPALAQAFKDGTAVLLDAEA